MNNNWVFYLVGLISFFNFFPLISESYRGWVKVSSNLTIFFVSSIYKIRQLIQDIFTEVLQIQIIENFKTKNKLLHLLFE